MRLCDLTHFDTVCDPIAFYKGLEVKTTTGRDCVYIQQNKRVWLPASKGRKFIKRKDGTRMYVDIYEGKR